MSRPLHHRITDAASNLVRHGTNIWDYLSEEDEDLALPDDVQDAYETWCGSGPKDHIEVGALVTALLRWRGSVSQQ